MARMMKDSGVEWIGEIPANWEIYRIKNLADQEQIDSFIDGDWIESPDISDEGIRYLTTGNVGDGQFKRQGNGFITEETFARLNCKYAYPEDLVIARLNAPYGRACILPDDFDRYVLAVDIVILRTKMNRQFLCFQMQCDGYQKSVEDEAKGTTMKRISRTNLGKIPLTIPSVEEQARIATFLERKCAEIDSVLAETEKTIEEYKALKQSIITEAVTKGVRGKRPMKDSGIEWIDQIPEDWNTYRIGSLYRERSENGNDELPILCVSINTGVSDHELHGDEQTRVFVRSEDRSKYKRVFPGDLTYNMMRAWQGAFGAVRVDGMVSPAYVVAAPTDNRMDSRYVESLLRIPSAIEEMHRNSHGIADFRLRLYWSQFKNIKICVPPIAEQIEIADYIDEKTSTIDKLVETKQRLLAELGSYKNAVIYEYVTGKKEIL